MIKASDLFKKPKFTQEELDKIWSIASGKAVYFNSKSPKENNDPLPWLLKYARNENWTKDLPFTKRRFYQIRDNERRNFNFERIIFYQEKGLTLQQIARLTGVSTATITKLRKGEQDV